MVLVVPIWWASWYGIWHRTRYCYSQFYILVVITDSAETTTRYIVTPEDTGSYRWISTTWSLIRLPDSEWLSVGTTGLHDRMINPSPFVTSEQWLYGAVTDAELVDNPAPYTDTCDENGFGGALSTGVYAYGSTFLSTLADDMSTTCTEWGSLGQDGFMEIILQDVKLWQIKTLWRCCTVSSWFLQFVGMSSCCWRTLNGGVER